MAAAHRLEPRSCLALQRRPLLRRALQPVDGLVEPATEEAPPDREVDHAVATPDRIHAERRVHEGPALRVGELPVNEHAAERAVHAYLPQVIDAVDEEAGLLVTDNRVPRELDELRPLLEPLSLDFKNAWEPLRITARVADQLPNGWDRRVEQCLLVDLRHQLVGRLRLLTGGVRIEAFSTPVAYTICGADMLAPGARGPSTSYRPGGNADDRLAPRPGGRAGGRGGKRQQCPKP